MTQDIISSQYFYDGINIKDDSQAHTKALKQLQSLGFCKLSGVFKPEYLPVLLEMRDAIELVDFFVLNYKERVGKDLIKQVIWRRRYKSEYQRMLEVPQFQLFDIPFMAGILPRINLGFSKEFNDLLYQWFGSNGIEDIEENDYKLHSFSLRPSTSSLDSKRRAPKTEWHQDQVSHHSDCDLTLWIPLTKISIQQPGLDFIVIDELGKELFNDVNERIHTHRVSEKNVEILKDKFPIYSPRFNFSEAIIFTGYAVHTIGVSKQRKLERMSMDLRIGHK